MQSKKISSVASHRFQILLRTIVCLPLLFGAQILLAQSNYVARLPTSEFDVRPPNTWISGAIGSMEVARAECRVFPEEQLRQRIVDIAKQEWAFFGYPEYQFDQQIEGLPLEERRRRRVRLSLEESVRVADTIAGYWSSTVEGGWIVERQNDEWNGPDGHGARWEDAWSAAFISWVMCEAGIADSSKFRHAIAHHRYIDQGIRARDGQDTDSLFVAYDGGEAEVLPGDLLCTGSRPQYQNLDQRRAQISEGARTHCDIVTEVNLDAGYIDTIGGNVQSTVTLKRISIEDGALLSPVDQPGRPVFAHLKMQLSGE